MSTSTMRYRGRPGPAPRGEAAAKGRERPDAYLAGDGLVHAVDVALMLGRPLLLTGDPGTGKTRLADSLAHELGLGEPLRFETKSTSTAADLFYTYNALARFHAAHAGEGSTRGLDYLTYNALGLAILLAKELTPVEREKLLPEGFHHDGPRRSVVLIDEVDKAPRDFPNDILNEIERLFFKVPELGNLKVEVDPRWRPIVVLTSNSEKDLPDAFLRRCVYHNIAFPDRDRLREIIALRSDPFEGRDGAFLGDALGLFLEFRKPTTGLRKAPGTAELLDWIKALHRMAPPGPNPLAGSPESVAAAVKPTFGAVAKTTDDQSKVEKVVDQWAKGRTT